MLNASEFFTYAIAKYGANYLTNWLRYVNDKMSHSEIEAILTSRRPVELWEDWGNGDYL